MDMSVLMPNARGKKASAFPLARSTGFSDRARTSGQGEDEDEPDPSVEGGGAGEGSGPLGSAGSSPVPPCPPGPPPVSRSRGKPAPQQNFGMPTPGLETIDLPSADTVPMPITRHWFEFPSGV